MRFVPTSMHVLFRYQLLYRDGTTLLLILLLTVLVFPNGCGTKRGNENGSGDSSPNITISVSPNPGPSLIVGQSQTFTALVTGTSDSTVKWYVSGVEGGNLTFGLITSAGVYTAPDIVPGSTPVIEAISNADQSKNASVLVPVNVPHDVPVLVWQKLIPDISGQIQGVFYSGLTSGALDTAGSLLVIGTTPDPAFPPPATPQYTGITLKLDSNGNLLWKILGTSASGIFTSGQTVVLATPKGLLGLGADGNQLFLHDCGRGQYFGSLVRTDLKVYYHISSTALMTSDLSGSPDCSTEIPIPFTPSRNIWSRENFSIASDHTLSTGATRSNSACWQGMTGFIREGDLQGNQKWEYSWQSSGNSQMMFGIDSLLLESSEDGTPYIYAANRQFDCNSHDKFNVIKMLTNGAIVWNRVWDNNAPDPTQKASNAPAVLISDPNGGVIMVGVLERTQQRDFRATDCGLVSYTANGEVRWGIHPTFSQNDLCSGAVVRADGRFMYVFGVANRQSFDSTSVTSPSSLLVAKYALPH